MHYLVIIIIIILLFLFYLTWVLKIGDFSEPGSLDKNEVIYQYQDIKLKLKTGDIILFSCKKHQSFTSEIKYFCRTTLLGSEYGHVGIILKSNNKLYVVECTSNPHTGRQYAYHLNNYNQGGVRIIDLEILLKEYYRDNTGEYAVKFIEKEIPNSHIFNNINKFKNMIFEHRLLLLFLGFIDTCISHNLAIYLSNILPENNTLMCSEFMHRLLCDCGILEEYPSKLFWPHTVNNKIFEDLEIIKYSKPYKFTLDESCTRDLNLACQISST